MLIRCPTCQRRYDDETRWTICPHGPLWAGPHDYCTRHDLVECHICKSEILKRQEAMRKHWTAPLRRAWSWLTGQGWK